MSRYSVLVVGMGKRGMHHAAAFSSNPRFQLTGICDIDPKRLDEAAAKLGNPQKGTDAAALAKAIRPDVFCFCTLPNLRVPFIQAAIRGGAKLIAFEKPIALTSAELLTIRDLLKSAGVKAVVSHQHRYGPHYQKVKEIIASGALGRIHTVYGTATGWMTHMLSHLVDYTCWFNNYVPAQWAMAQASGGAKFADNHPPDQPEVAKWWGKNRIGAQGTEGFAEVLTNGGWRAVTKSGGYQSGEGAMNYDRDMPPYIQEMADWLDNRQVHQCNFEHASVSGEIMLALQRSAAQGGQVGLPLTDGADEQALLKARVAGQSVLVSCEQNRKEFGIG
jgi:predicted dehydrogenase